MQTSGEEQRGHVLLIAGARATHRRTVQVIPSANLAALTAVPVPVLLGSTLPADFVHLDGARDQNTMLIRLRTAAAASGPLLVYLAGLLTVDRKNHRLHLASPGSTAGTTRYTALPWEWVQNELRRRPGPTTVLVDMAADKAAWSVLHERGGLPEVNAEVYGVITPPGLSGTADGISVYTQHLIDVLRSRPERPENARLHTLTVAAAAIPPGTLVLPNTPRAEGPCPPDTAETQPKAPIKRLLSGDRAFLPTLRRRESASAPAPASAPAEFDAYPPFPPAATSNEAQPHVGDHPWYQERQPAAPSPFPVPAPQQPAALPPASAPAPAPAPAPLSPPPAGSPAPSTSPAPASPPLASPQRQPVPDPLLPETPAAQPTPPPQPALPQQSTSTPTPAPASPPLSPPPPASPATPAPPSPTPAPDPKPLIWQAAQAGRHDQAAEMAAAWEQQALQRYGYDSPQATEWAEIRADLARIAGRWPLATQLWVAAARTRLAHQPPDSAEVLNAARGAHYCWNQITDPDQAIENGPELINLLRQLPALDPRHVSTAQSRLQYLHQQPTGGA
ncbi:MULTISPECIES: hypothetical protein [unclassified Streptomyces]|uniref:hypothetical protein n=1 Tax=unclassified Streptomyces TaxID=2593676 RepID=UPI00037952D8|nr:MULTISPECIES: hypothetical protein [unclassified Streptomyces]MYT31390.1 hypothetical protein [Streptomyces sp. SID8354]